jgi:gamma-glutamyl-gamma-aminobutyrate hydrolase PuuD
VSRRPRIALTLSRPDSPQRVDSLHFYREALVAAGAEVVELYPGDGMPTDVDGLLISGGGDVDPARYGEPNRGSHHIEDERDTLEFAAYERAKELGLPVLGICRGFQVLNVARGGKLLQDVDGHAGPPEGEEWVNAHESVRPAAGSRLAEATGGAPVTVNSRHHQAVTQDVLGEGLTATASVGNLIEAFESVDGHWLVGVQWHPERASEVSPGATGIIDAFVAQAARR